jgi:hypothetical protein
MRLFTLISFIELCLYVAETCDRCLLLHSLKDFVLSCLPACRLDTRDDRANGNAVGFNLVQEDVAWFSGTGNHTLRLHVPQVPSSSGQVWEAPR